MRAYVARRSLQGLVVIWILATATFVLFRLMPGDPTAVFVNDGMPPAARAQVLSEFGLDKPLGQQYVIYLGNLAQGNFGLSFFYRQPVWNLLIDRLLNSVLLILPAIALGTSLGTLAGAFVGWARRGSAVERAGVLVATVIRGTPSFILGVLGLMVFSYWAGWLPNAGMRSPGAPGVGFAGTYLNTDFASHAVLPLVVLGLTYFPESLLLMRTAMLETRGEDYLELVRAKGVPERRVALHAARNSLLPVITYILNTIGFSIAGVVVVETVFSWPGIGRELALSVTRLDFPVAQATFFVIAVVVVGLNLLADLLYAALDPRVVYR
jgi:peptide/nickel transport system permease protein